MTNKTSKKELESLVVACSLSTSNKKDNKFKGEPRKTVYITPSSDADTELLKKFGMTEYTPTEETDENGKPNLPFFICKSSEQVAVYNYDMEMVETLEMDAKAPNIKVDETISISIIKGHSKGNDYYRLTDLLVADMTQIEVLKRENPFLNKK